MIRRPKVFLHLGVLERVLIRGARDADRLSRDARACGLEGRHRRRRAPAHTLVGPGRSSRPISSLPPSRWVARQLDVLEHDLGGVRRPDPHLLVLLAHRQPGRVGGGTTKPAWPRAPRSGATDATTTCTAAMPPLVIHDLTPFSRPGVARLVEHGASLQVADVRAGVGLRHAKGPEGDVTGLPEAPGDPLRHPVRGYRQATMAATGRVEPRIERAMPASPQANSSLTSASRRPDGSRVAVRDEVERVQPDLRWPPR